MYRASAPRSAPPNGDHDTRSFSRIPVVIPVRIEILRPSKRAVFASIPGALLNVGCGGGRVRISWEIPPRSRLLISLPAGTPSLRLLAEVSWASWRSGSWPGPTEYGVRWVEPLTSCVLQSALLRQGLEGGWEGAYVRGARA